MKMKNFINAKIRKFFTIAKYTGVKKKSLSTLAKALFEPINNKNLQISKIFCSIAKVNKNSEPCKLLKK